MRRLLLLALAASAALGAPLPKFPQAESDLPPDPAAHFGVLPNGLRYLVRANSEPHSRASLRLVVLSGSFEERENQRGLAHFLEHMAFNGSKHYPPGTLVEYFQRLGMSFGGDTNAYTSFDRTVFKIELPDVKTGTVAEGLRVFADMAGTLLLTPAMIDKERPIILSEERTRDSASYRQFVASFSFLLPDTLPPERMPIGLKPVISEAHRERFVDYYNTWYRPERIVVVVVGAVDPAAVVAQIGEAFGALQPRSSARPDPYLGRLAGPTGVRASYHHEPDAPTTTVDIDSIAPYSHQADTAERRGRNLRRDLAAAMLNRRFDILSKKEGAPFVRAQLTVEDSFDFVHDAEVEINCPPANWPAALAVGEQELRRALRYGFTPAELAEAKANLANGLEQAAAGASTERSDEIADQMVESLGDKRVFTSPVQDLAFYRPLIAAATAEDCAAALRQAFAGPGRDVMVLGNASIPGDAAAAVSRAYDASLRVAVAPPVAAGSGSFSYTDFGPPGRILSTRRVDDLGIVLVRFANGVRVNLKKTNFEANKIRLRLRVGAGRLLQPASAPGLAFYTDLTFEEGGLGRHSADDLQTILAGRTLGFDFAVNNDALEIAGETNREDLLLQLQLFAAYLADPGYRPEAARLARKNIDEVYTEFEHAVQGPLRTVVPRFLADGDSRFGLPDRSAELGLTLDEEKDWLRPQLAFGPIEIGIAGDFDLDATIDALSRTLGALPPRAERPSYAAERRVRFPAPPAAPLSYTVSSRIPKAVVAVYWPTADARDVHRTRRLNLLADILGDRMRVRLREQLGAAYDPAAASDPSDTYTDYGRILAEVVVAPARADEALRSILAIAADLQARGVTPDELERAKKPLLTALRESARTNPYWLTAVLGNCQEYPDRLDWARTRESDVAAVTPAEIDALAKSYLISDKSFKVIVLPSGKGL